MSDPCPTFGQRPRVQAADLDGNLSLYAEGQQHAVLLNATASALWRLLAQRRSLEELVAQLADDYAVDGSLIADDVRTTLEELVRLGFLDHE